MKRIFRRPSRAMVISVIAVFFAIGGIAVAQTVGNHSDKARTAAKCKCKRGPQGPAGPQGPQGPAGPAGPSVLGKITRVVGPTVTIPAGGISHAEADCPSGQGLVSGGFTYISAEGETFYEDDFGSGNSWLVGGDNFDSSISGDLNAIAYCAPTGTAISRSARAAARDRADAADARQKAMHGL